MLACFRVSEWRAAPPVHGVDIRAPSDEVLNRSEVAFGGAEMEGRPIVLCGIQPVN